MNDNKKILGLVDSRIKDVETAFKQLEDLISQKSGFSQRLIEANSAEYRALNNHTLSEDAAVQAITNAHALKEVTAARLANAERSISATKTAIVGIGRYARDAATEVAQQFANFEFKAALALVDATFEGQPLGSNEFLARHARRFVEADRLSSAVAAQISDISDIDSLRSLRSAFAPIAKAVESTDGLVLTLPANWVSAGQ